MEKSDFNGFKAEAIDWMKSFLTQTISSSTIDIDKLTVHAKEAIILTEKKQSTLPGTTDPLYATIGKEMEKFFTQIEKFVAISNLDELIEELVWTPAADPKARRLQQRLRKKLTLTRRTASISSYHRGELQLSGMMWLLAQLRKGGVYDCTTSLMAESFKRQKDDLPDFNEQMKFYLQQFSTTNNFRTEEDKELSKWIIDRCLKEIDHISSWLSAQ